jgi:hypothetical protein
MAQPTTKLELGFEPASLVVDPTTHLHVAGGPQGVSYALASSASPTFASLVSDQVVEPRAIAIRGSAIYWANTGGEIWTADPLVPVAPHVIVTGQGTIGGLAADETRLYWTARGTSKSAGEVRSAPLAGSSAPVTLASNQYVPGAIVVTATAVFWLNAGEVDQPNGSVARLLK